MRFAFLALLVLSGCVVHEAPGMAPHATGRADEAARVQPKAGERALVVVYPRSPCSGSARMVLVDADRHFVGAVGPGEAAILVVPETLQHLFAISAVDVTAAPGTWSTYQTLHVPAAPNGFVATTSHRDHRHCGSGQYAPLATASKEQIETTLAESSVRWLEPRPQEGQAWLDAHEARIHEVLASR